MNTNDVSLVIPSYNNLNHLKNAYNSVRRHYTDVPLIIIDDASDDGTYEWLQSLSDSNLTWWREEERKGHTILYDLGIKSATTPIIGILHADMYVGPMYIENMLKHLKKGTVVCATRVEPPLHPPGKEKIIKDFGQDFDSLDISGFYNFAKEEQEKSKDETSRGMFAPWILYADDFWEVGGHDKRLAPYGYEDSDIFQRWFLNGYGLIQSRDSLVYHLTCRGHRWTKGVGIDNSDYKDIMDNSRREYIKKWGSWIETDEWLHPVIIPVYGKRLIMTKPNEYLESKLDVWFNGGDGVEVEVNPDTFTEEDYKYIILLNKIIENSGKVGEFRLGNLHIKVTSLDEKQHGLIKV